MEKILTVSNKNTVNFVSYSKGEDGSGYAVLDTETLTGVELYSDTDPEAGYYMEFDQTGKIVKVHCGAIGW